MDQFMEVRLQKAGNRGARPFVFVAFSPDSRWLAACGVGEDKLCLWRAPSWEEIEAEEKKMESGKLP